MTITATRTKRDKSLGRPVDILRPEVASQNSRVHAVFITQETHTETGSSNTIFAGQRIRLPRHVPASCITVHERTYARRPKIDHAVIPVHSPHQSRNSQ